MRSLFRHALGLSLLSALSATFVVGCADDSSAGAPTEADEQALTEAKVLAKGVAYPSGLAAAGDHVYFGANHFVASGDPELDQQFAYWEGKFSRVTMNGGRPQTVVEVGPINRVRVAGSKLYYAMSDGCWISRVDAAQSSATAGQDEVYRDDDCDPEGGPSMMGFELTNDKLVIVRNDGEVKIAKQDGTGIKKLGEVRVGNWGDLVETQTVADGHVWILTRDHLTDAQDRPVKPALYKISLEGAAPNPATKVLEAQARWSNLTSDGKNLFWNEGNKVMMLAAGTSAPKQVADAFGEITDIAADGPNLFVADSGRGSIYIVRDVATDAKPKKKLANARGITSLIATGGKVFFGTHVIEDRKAAGIIGSIAVP